MKIYFNLVVLILISTISINSYSQEFDAKVQVMSQQIQGTNKQIYRTLQSEIYEFINNKKWTNHVFSPEEKIDCNIMITFTQEISVDEFKGKIQIQARRPIYNSSYNSVLLNYVDNNFVEGMYYLQDTFVDNFVFPAVHFAFRQQSMSQYQHQLPSL